MKNRGGYPYFEKSVLYFKGKEDNHLDGDSRELSDSTKEELVRYVVEEAIPTNKDYIIRKQKESMALINKIQSYKDNGYMEKVMQKEIEKLTEKFNKLEDLIAREKDSLLKLERVKELKTTNEFLDLPCFRN